MSSYSTAGFAAGNSSSQFQFGPTHVVRPKGTHKATIVWLHGLGDVGLSWAQLLETLPIPHVKWICPTAPTRPIELFGGFPSTAWFDVTELKENTRQDMSGMDVAAAHVVNLLSSEPSDIKLGIGGFSMGAALTIYSATCSMLRKYADDIEYPIHFTGAVALSGWFPCASELSKRLQDSPEAQARAASFPILLCHGTTDEVIAFRLGEKSSDIMKSSGYSNLQFNVYEGLKHHTNPKELAEVSQWIAETFGLTN